MEIKMLTFVTGGVRSGKSEAAETKAIQLRAESGRLLYVACGRSSDQEMARRIFRHKQRRRDSAYQWLTVEKPLDLNTLKVTPSDTVLIDCITTLLANEYFRFDKPQNLAIKRILDGIEAICLQAKAVVVVSNELCFEAPASELTKQYMKTLGQIHQVLVQKSDTAILVENGISIVKKGKRL